MATFELLYAQAPHLVWLATACMLVGLSLSVGAGLLMSPAAAAAIVAGAVAAGWSAPPESEVEAFAGLSLALGLAWSLHARRGAARRARRIDSAPQRRGGADPPQDLTGRLIGRIAEARSDFANGVGRVWIDEAEWAAELDEGEEVARGEPVRVVKVIAGVRLQVHPLIFG